MMARIVDVGGKPAIRRRAVAQGAIRLRPSTVRAIRQGGIEKGDPLPAAEVAALHAMKGVWQVLPHCHPVPITAASATFALSTDRVTCTTTVEATYMTGVEMEALYGAAVGLLTVWDMVKSLEKDSRGQYPTARIEGLRVVAKEKNARARPRARRDRI